MKDEELSPYLRHEHHASELRVIIHELLGHGTGNRLLRQEASAGSNFDLDSPPIDPVTSQPIQTWYKDNDSDCSVFGQLNQTLSECRADGVGLYLLSEKSLLSIFGFRDDDDLKADDSMCLPFPQV